MASALDQPVSRSATEFIQATFREASLVITPLPIDCRVTRSRSCCSAKSETSLRYSVMSLLVPTMRTARPAASRVTCPVALIR